MKSQYFLLLSNSKDIHFLQSIWIVDILYV